MSSDEMFMLGEASPAVALRAAVVMFKDAEAAANIVIACEAFASADGVLFAVNV